METRDTGKIIRETRAQIAYVAEYYRYSAEDLACVSLELGGKSPFIVFEDADLDSAVNAQVAGIFAATGQSCVAGSRLLVQNSVKAEFLDRLRRKAEQIVVGLPGDMANEVGPLCSAHQRAHVLSLIERSREKGARIVTGGTAPEGEGFYFRPTILDCSGAPDALCLTQEFFGPVLSVVGSDDEEDAVRIANDTDYGLGSGVFTRDLTRAHRMIRRIRAGIVWVNTYRAVSPIAPFGGHGLSGFGREGGLAAALDYTTVKTVWLRVSDGSDPGSLRDALNAAPDGV